MLLKMDLTMLLQVTDYQAPLTAGTDYQTPLVAGTDYQIPITGPIVASVADTVPA